MFSRQKIRRIGGGWLGAALLALAGCGQGGADRAAAPSKTVADYFPIRVGAQTVRMQLAVYPAEMERGLMERRDLAADQGMLFVYAQPQQMSFWMHDTPTPLGIGFFNAAGELLEVYPMQPYDESVIKSRSTAVQFALEMNQGWFRGQGVQPGDRLDLQALGSALQARGLKPAAFGLK